MSSSITRAVGFRGVYQKDSQTDPKDSLTRIDDTINAGSPCERLLESDRFAPNDQRAAG